ncbi:MAG: DUF2231 domain-containing protein [Chthoniobacterales bacterium]|nr:DUF2231 domain-containing protein [Chthoniobacterales bacterium]
MSILFWSQVHGATTHFPIAFLFGGALFDTLGFFRRGAEASLRYLSAGFYSILVAGLGSFAAVVSGLIVNGWKLVGTGLLLQHHRYVWSAFALTVGLTTWRAVVGYNPSRPALAFYLVVLFLACALVGGAGWTGGHLVGR